MHEALRDSEERFRAAFDDAPVGVAMASLDPGRRGEYLAVNAAFCELTGYPREQLLAGMSDRHLDHPEDRVGGRAHERGAAGDGDGVVQQEKRFVRADGTTIWVRRSSSVIRRNGRPWYAIVHCGDITASRHAEEELAESEGRFRAAFDDAPVGMGLIGLTGARAGQYLRVNAVLSKVTGYGEDELVGMDFRALTHPDDRVEDDAAAAELALGLREHTQRDKRLLHRDGRFVWVRSWTSVVKHEGRTAYAIEHVQDITSHKSAEELLAHQALYDGLTGIANRHLVMEHLQQALARLGREHGRVAVLYLDVDRFKGVNDTLGHEAGDQLLIEVAARVRATVRGVDTPGRLGGDEFAIVCPDISDAAGACRLAARIAEAVAAPLQVAGRTLHPQVSMGVALARSSTVGAADLLHQADTAMYAAKQRGRGRIELYRSSLDIPEQRRAVVETDLMEAIRHGWLHLQYQPVIEIQTGEIVAAEALLRVAHPERGLLGPHSFIDVAEESDLIFQIEDWVLRRACAQLADWQRDFPRGPLEMAVNISGRQSARLALYRRVCTAARAAGVALSSLCLEMTERVLIDADHSVNADLQKLASRGVGIAIDDFGTGYSSLSYLQRFPVSTLKIDRTFVAGLGRNARDEAIVSAVTALGRALDLTIIAEGVETGQQLERVRQLGGHRAQGYLFAKPCDADDFARLLERQADAGALVPAQRSIPARVRSPRR